MNKQEIRSVRRGFAIQILAGEVMALANIAQQREAARGALHLAGLLIEEIETLEMIEDAAEAGTQSVVLSDTEAADYWAKKALAGE